MTDAHTEAERRYPGDSDDLRDRAAASRERDAFIAGRTVTAEQIEQAAQGILDAWIARGSALPNSALRWEFLADARAAFKAAGFIVEGPSDG